MLSSDPLHALRHASLDAFVHYAVLAKHNDWQTALTPKIAQLKADEIPWHTLQDTIETLNLPRKAEMLRILRFYYTDSHEGFSADLNGYQQFLQDLFSSEHYRTGRFLGVVRDRIHSHFYQAYLPIIEQIHAEQLKLETSQRQALEVQVANLQSELAAKTSALQKLHDENRILKLTADRRKMENTGLQKQLEILAQTQAHADAKLVTTADLGTKLLNYAARYKHSSLKEALIDALASFTPRDSHNIGHSRLLVEQLSKTSEPYLMAYAKRLLAIDPARRSSDPGGSASASGSLASVYRKVEVEPKASDPATAPGKD